MATLTFDKLAYVDRLQAAGMGEREARALAEGLDQALREEVATKTDIAAVKTDLAAVKTGLSVEIAAVDTRLTTVEHKLQSRFRRRSTMCCAGWSAWRSPRPALPWRSLGSCRTKHITKSGRSHSLRSDAERC